MRHFDLTPLYRSTVGYDRLANVLDQVMSGDVSQNTYPPYNIEKTGDDAYRISIAVAGFAESDLNIEAREGQLIVSGRKVEDENAPKPSYMHQGIANRAFERRFQLAEHVHAKSATTENGLLHIDLIRKVPEALKPRTIQISTKNAIEDQSANA